MEKKGKVKKIFNNAKNHVLILDDDMKLSAFGKCPEDIKEGKFYEFRYETKGEYNNYKDYQLVDEDGPQPEIKEEIISADKLPTLEDAKKFKGKSKLMRHFSATDPEKLTEAVNGYGVLNVITAWSPPVLTSDGFWHTFICYE